LRARISELRGQKLDVTRFKLLTGLSRKYAIPLLEYLDRERSRAKTATSALSFSHMVPRCWKGKDASAFEMCYSFPVAFLSAAEIL